MSSNSMYRIAKSTSRTRTCEMCKSRHQKCNGAQPHCNNCELRSIPCSYSGLRPSVPDGPVKVKPPLSAKSVSSSLGMVSRQPDSSSTEYNQLYAQIFDDIVRCLQLDRHPGSDPHAETSVLSRKSRASLPSLYEDVSSILRELVKNDSQQALAGSNTTSTTDYIREAVIGGDLEHVRKLLRDSLPSQDQSQRLLDLFFKYQNSIFYVCNQAEAQAQLLLMYKDPEETSISWFCQMFLILAVGAQFDEFSDGEGVSYHQISQRYIDDAIEENPQNTLWVVRAMLLLCLYQPPTKWASIWIYLDAAIRGAHRFQLDLGYNPQKELSDEEYSGWRQLWLSVISFDRWVAIFLGRLPRINESLSRDPVFKGLHVESGLQDCRIQNHITGLAVISGYVLRDMYFSEQFSLGLCRQHKTELENWMSKLPDPLRKQLEFVSIADLCLGTSEAVFNLHFMYRGIWMLLMRTSLVRVVKMKALELNLAGSTGQAISSNARLCVEHASHLISIARAFLDVSLPLSRSFMPLFFLVNAAHITILRFVWKLKQSKGVVSLASGDQSGEFAAIDEATRILDFCGQRNVFARKHSELIKDLRQTLSKSLAGSGVDTFSPPSGATYVSSPYLSQYSTSAMPSSQTVFNSDQIPLSQGVFQDTDFLHDPRSASLPNEDITGGQNSAAGSLDANPKRWAEDIGVFYPSAVEGWADVDYAQRH